MLEKSRNQIINAVQSQINKNNDLVKADSHYEVRRA